MKLKFSKRGHSKGEVNALRRESQVPACVYVRGQAAENIAVDGNVFASHLRKVQSGRLSTTVFNLEGEGNAEFRAIIKEIQYHPTTYAVLHLDFEKLTEDAKINVKVPIECTGVVDCVGVKLGGVLRQVIRHLRVRCFPKDLPTAFNLDVRNLNMRDSRRLKDLEIPNTVQPLADLNEVAVVIAKR